MVVRQCISLVKVAKISVFTWVLHFHYCQLEPQSFDVGMNADCNLSHHIYKPGVSRCFGGFVQWETGNFFYNSQAEECFL